jgi:hypothetical protein
MALPRKGCAAPSNRPRARNGDLTIRYRLCCRQNALADIGHRKKFLRESQE